MRRIRQISIKNLFGIFHHDIMLNMDERVTIIHSPNGFGKTAILKLLNELFTQGTSVIRTTPFDEFHVYFEDQGHFWIEKKIGEVNLLDDNGKSVERIRRPQVMFHFSDSEGKPVFEWELPEREVLVRHFQPHFQILQQSLFERQVEDRQPIEEAYEESLRYLLTAEESALLAQEKKWATVQAKVGVHGEEQSWFQEIRDSVPIRFIETQRLLNATAETRNQRTVRRPALLPAVTLYSEELSKTITARLADSSTLTQSLDRTFPSRLVDLATRQSDISESELRKKLAELEMKRKSLVAVGLADQNANDAILAANRIDANTKAVLSLYIEDTQQKLAIFNDIVPQIELLTQIINKRFLYKEMSISRKDGFVFTTPKGTRLALETLSSGEQHELILFYELLFKASPGSLIMIDEPEISLHVMWQEQFLQDVQDITRLADVDVLIATHSPDIIDGHRDLVVELEGPEDEGL